MLLPGLGEHLADDASELVIAVRTAILDIEFESTGGAQTLHRRRRHGKNRGVANRAELLVECRHDRAGRQVLRSALLEGRQWEEDDGRVAQIHEALH